MIESPCTVMAQGLFLLYIHSLAGIQEIQCPARHFFLQNLLQRRLYASSWGR